MTKQLLNMKLEMHKQGTASKLSVGKQFLLRCFTLLAPNSDDICRLFFFFFFFFLTNYQVEISLYVKLKD